MSIIQKKLINEVYLHLPNLTKFSHTSLNTHPRPQLSPPLDHIFPVLGNLSVRN